MKILVVHEVSYLSKIIYEFQILPEILSILGHEVTVIDYDDTWFNHSRGGVFDLKTRIHRGIHRAYPQAAVTVRRPGMVRLPIVSRLSGAVTSGLEVLRVLKHDRADVVLLYGLPTVGIQALLAARRHHVPILFRSIDVIYRLVPYPVLVPPTRILERYVYNRVDGIVAVTPHLKKHVQSYGVPESRVRVLPSGVDSEIFSPGKRDDTLLAKWGIGPGDPVILFMGTIYRFSGLDRVISDFPQLLSRYSNAKLLIVGYGEDEERLKRLAVQAGVSSNVVFAGLQAYSGLPEIIRSSDVCINPFELNGVTRDILPTKLFQYLACGKPVLMTELPGTVPFLAGEQHGVVYTSLSDFVPNLAGLLDDRDRRATLGRRGEEVARGTYDWKRIAEKMVSWIAEMT